MPDNPLANATEVFSAPIESVIVALGKGISEAQRALDQSSIAAQQAIDSDPILSRQGLQATWYQFPKVDLQLKLALTIAQDGAAQAPQAAGGVADFSKAIRLVAQPVSAAYKTHFNYTAEAASTITLSIVPVPAPRAADQSTVAPRMAIAEVQKAALSSPAKFVKDAQGGPAASLRFDINFNATAGLWYVLQYDPLNPATKPVVVAVDDATGRVQVISTP